jgi:hypothetical protein
MIDAWKEMVMTKVSIELLRAVTDALLSHLESKGVKSVTISEDFYWEVTASQRYEIKSPANIRWANWRTMLLS